MVSDRERFLMVLANGPLLSADAIVVLAGEDASGRAKTAVELFRQGAAPCIVVTGGIDDPPARRSAESIAPEILGGGVAPDRVLVEPTAMHTQEQAVAVAQMATAGHWRRILIVASPYHLPRAFLTFVRAFTVLGLQDAVRLVPCGAAHLSWWQSPEGVEPSRLDLLDVEFAKCEQYAEHVATWAEGLAYLQSWEGR